MSESTRFNQRDALIALRKKVRLGTGVTDRAFEDYCSWLYNVGVLGNHVAMWRDVYQKAARHAVPNAPKSVYQYPDGTTNLYLQILIDNTKDEPLRQRRGMKVYHLLTALLIPRSWAHKIMQAYYPAGTLVVKPARGSIPRMTHENGTYVMYV